MRLRKQHNYWQGQGSDPGILAPKLTFLSTKSFCKDAVRILTAVGKQELKYSQITWEGLKLRSFSSFFLCLPQLSMALTLDPMI